MKEQKIESNARARGVARTPCRSALVAVFILGLSLPSTVASAGDPSKTYEGVRFTPVVTDPADFPADGWLDLREIAIGEVATNPASSNATEDGDEGSDEANITLVFRIQVENWKAKTSLASGIFVTLMVEDGCTSIGINSNGRPSPATGWVMGTCGALWGGTRDVPFKSCDVQGNFAYCRIPLSVVGATVGDSLGQMAAYSYGQGALFYPFGVPLDSATGGSYEVKGIANAGNVTNASVPLEVGGENAGVPGPSFLATISGLLLGGCVVAAMARRRKLD